MGNREPIVLPPLIRCPHCNYSIATSSKISITYFYEAEFLCPNCKGKIDWWDAILKAVKTDFFLFQILAPVNAQSVAFQLTFTPNRRIIINLADYGIPDDAKILDIIYTPASGGLFPVEMRGNRPMQHIVYREMTLYPIPLTDSVEAKETVVNIMVTWVPHSSEDESWQNLVDAFEAFSHDHFNNCIIPANVAVESKLSILLTRYLESFAAKKTIKDFLENGATYSHQLNVLLSLVIDTKKLPKLPDHIRGSLNRLRALRNDIAHEGKLERVLKKEQAAELIVSALFGFHYLTLISENLFKE